MARHGCEVKASEKRELILADGTVVNLADVIWMPWLLDRPETSNERQRSNG